MPLVKGEIVGLTVTFVTADGCWGIAGDWVGFVHHSGWSKERPIPESAVPSVGQVLRVRILKVVKLGEAVPAWATFGGKFNIDFSAMVDFQ